jgi:hypothetical protein
MIKDEIKMKSQGECFDKKQIALAIRNLTFIDDGCYAFDEHGKMYCNCVTPDGYKVDVNGD